MLAASISKTSMWLEFDPDKKSTLTSVDIGIHADTVKAAEAVKNLHGNRFSFILCDSKKVRKQLEGQLFDLAVIDGDHSDPGVASDIRFEQNNIVSKSSNADIVLKPAGTGNIVFPALTIEDNNIKLTRSNDDLKISANGAGKVVIDGLGFSGTSIVAVDSATVNINENLDVDGTLNAGAPTLSGAVTINSTLDVTGASTLSTLTVSGASSFVGTTTVDNLLFNDNIISTSSNADLNLSPGGTGVVNVSNLTIDSSINLTDNVIKVTRSNDDFVLSGNGTGSVQVSKICLLYTSPSPRDQRGSGMPSCA